MPDIRAAASYFTAVRGLAAIETHQRLDLFCGAPAEWLQQGDGYRVFGMPTAFGPLDLSGDWDGNTFIVKSTAGPARRRAIASGGRGRLRPNACWPMGKASRHSMHIGASLPHDFQGTVEAVFPYLAPWPREP